MEKDMNSSVSSRSQISFPDPNTAQDFHYSIHENSVLYKSKKSKNLMNSNKETSPNTCNSCFNPSQKSPSILNRISSIFCCYIPKKTAQKNPNNKSIIQKPITTVDSPKTIGSFDNCTVFGEFPMKKVIEDSEEKLGSEINMMIPNSRKQTSIPRCSPSKPGSGSVQAKFPFLKKNYISAKLALYPENSLFFLRNNDNFVIARLKFNDFYSDETFQENNEQKLRNCSKFAVNSLLYENKKIKFLDHQSSFDNTKNAKNKHSIISLSDENLDRENNCTYDARLRPAKPKSQNYMRNLNIFEKKIKIDSESWEFMNPEKVSNYLAKRCHLGGSEIILDAFCGIGLNSIQFFKEDFQVIALDSRKNAVDYAHYNAQVHGIIEGINYIKGEFLEMNLNAIMPDVILINPVLKWNLEKKFSLLKNFCFDYHQVLLKSLKMVRNVVLCLPRYAEISEIIELFAGVFNEIYENDEDCIEIEYLFINKELQQIVVFCGPVAGINRKDIRDFLLDKVNKDNKTCQHKQIDFIQSIISKIGIKSAAKYILAAELKHLNNETILQKFIDSLKANKELSNDELEECLKEKDKEKKEVLLKEEKFRDLVKREQCLLLNFKDENKEKKNFKGSRKGSHSNMFEMQFDNFLEIPRNKTMNKLSQEVIQETPTYSYYSGKLMSSIDQSNDISEISMKSKELPKEYSFKKNSPPVDMPRPRKYTGKNSFKKKKDLEFWDKNDNGFMKVVNSNKDKDKNKSENKFTEYKCKYIDFV